MNSNVARIRVVGGGTLELRNGANFDAEVLLFDGSSFRNHWWPFQTAVVQKAQDRQSGGSVSAAVLGNIVGGL